MSMVVGTSQGCIRLMQEVICMPACVHGRDCQSWVPGTISSFGVLPNPPGVLCPFWLSASPGETFSTQHSYIEVGRPLAPAPRDLDERDPGRRGEAVRSQLSQCGPGSGDCDWLLRGASIGRRLRGRGQRYRRRWHNFCQSTALAAVSRAHDHARALTATPIVGGILLLTSATPRVGGDGTYPVPYSWVKVH